MTPVLAMTVVREAAIAAFVPEKFYTVALTLDQRLHGIQQTPHSQKAVAENLLEACRKEMVATVQTHHPQGKVRESTAAV